jgi:hypothetical protein
MFLMFQVPLLGPRIAMHLLASREHPVIDCQTLTEFIGHERLFRGTDGSFLLYMSSDGKPEAEERIAWLSVRDAISWLNEAPDQFGFFWGCSEVAPGWRHPIATLENLSPEN